MKSLMILAAEAETHQVVTPFEEALLAGLVFIIMFGLGAGLTPKDFVLAVRRPQGLIIGFLTQFGIMRMIPNWVRNPMIKPCGRRTAKTKSFGVSPAPSPNMMIKTSPASSASSNGVTT